MSLQNRMLTLMGPYSVNFSAAFDVGPSLRYIIYRSHRSVHVMLKFFDNIRFICGKKLYVKVFKRNTGNWERSLPCITEFIYHGTMREVENVQKHVPRNTEITFGHQRQSISSLFLFMMQCIVI